MKTYSNKSTDPKTDPKKKVGKTITRDSKGNLVATKPRPDEYGGVDTKEVDAESRRFASKTGSSNQMSSMGSGYKDKVNKLQGASKKQVKASKKFKVKSNASKAAKKASNRARKMF
jgi:hypothetical protein